MKPVRRKLACWFVICCGCLALPSVTCAATVGLDNTRFIWTGAGGGGVEDFFGYYIHSDFQGATLMQFDLSSHMGETATSDATFTLPVDSFFSHWSSAASHNMRLWQLSSFNSDADLDDANGNFRDASSSTPWLANDGSALGTWNAGNFFDVIDSTTPIATTAGVNAGNDLIWTIPQATMQSWLDGSEPSIVVFGNDGWVSGVFNGSWEFNQAGADLSFATVPEPGTFAACLSLVGIAFMRRRQMQSKLA